MASGVVFTEKCKWKCANSVEISFERRVTFLVVVISVKKLVKKHVKGMPVKEF